MMDAPIRRTSLPPGRGQSLPDGALDPVGDERVRHGRVRCLVRDMVGHHEQRGAGHLALPVPPLGNVVGAPAGDDRPGPGDEAVESRRAGSGHAHPRVEPARDVAALERGEQRVAAQPERLAGDTVAGPAMKSSTDTAAVATTSPAIMLPSSGPALVFPGEPPQPALKGTAGPGKLIAGRQ